MKSDVIVAGELFLTTREAAARLRFEGPNAVVNFFKWANRHGVPRLKRGHVCLWRESVLIAFLERKAWTRLHAPQSASSSTRRLRDGATQ